MDQLIVDEALPHLRPFGQFLRTKQPPQRLLRDSSEGRVVGEELEGVPYGNS